MVDFILVLGVQLARKLANTPPPATYANFNSNVCGDEWTVSSMAWPFGGAVNYAALASYVPRYPPPHLLQIRFLLVLFPIVFLFSG